MFPEFITQTSFLFLEDLGSVTKNFRISFFLYKRPTLPLSPLVTRWLTKHYRFDQTLQVSLEVSLRTNKSVVEV